MPNATKGFASMSPEKRREIASKGGKSVPAAKRMFSTNKALAAEAGRKGGKSVLPANRTFTHNLELARAAGSIGGKTPRRARSATEQVAVASPTDKANSE